MKKVCKKVLAMVLSIAVMASMLVAVPVMAAEAETTYYSTDFSNCGATADGTLYAGQADTDKVSWSADDTSEMKVYDNLDSGILRLTVPGGKFLAMQMKDVPKAGKFTVNYQLYVGNTDANFNVKIGPSNTPANAGCTTLRFYTDNKKFAIGDPAAELTAADGKTATLANLGITAGNTDLKTNGVPVTMVIDMDTDLVTASLTGRDGTVYSGSTAMTADAFGRMTFHGANRMYLGNVKITVPDTTPKYYSTDFSNCGATASGTLYAGQADTDKVSWSADDTSEMKVYDNLDSGILRLTVPGGKFLAMQMKDVPKAGKYTVNYQLYLGNTDANFNVKLGPSNTPANSGCTTLRFYAQDRFAIGDPAAELTAADGKTATLANLGITAGDTDLKTKGVPVTIVVDMETDLVTVSLTGRDGTVYSGSTAMTADAFGRMTWHCANRVYLANVDIVAEIPEEEEPEVVEPEFGTTIYTDDFSSQSNTSISHDGITWVTSKELTADGLQFVAKDQEPGGSTVSAPTSSHVAVQIDPAYNDDVYELSYYYYMNGTDGTMYTGVSDSKTATDSNLTNVLVYDASSKSFTSNGVVLTATDGSQATLANVYGSAAPDAKNDGRLTKLRFDFANKQLTASIRDGKGKIFSAMSTMELSALGSIHWICGNRVYLGRMRVGTQLLNEIKTSISTENTGNIFFSDEVVSFDYTFTNKIAEAKEIEYYADIIDADGEFVDTIEGTVTVPALSTITETVVVSGLKYGLYTLECSAFEGDNTYLADTRFAYVKKSGKTNIKAGVNTVFNTNNPDVDEVMPLIDAAGFGGTRNDITWTSVEAEKGVYTIRTVLGDYIAEANRLGIDVLAIGGGRNPLYTANEDGYPDASDATAMAALKEYYRQMASKLSGKITYFEVVNEPNHNMSAADYVVYLKNAYEGLKEGSNNAAQVVGVVSGPEDEEFYEGVFAAGGGAYMDIVSCHPYYNGSIGTSNDWWSGVITELKALMSTYNISKPLWITETNVYQHPEYDPSAYTDVEMAAYFTRAFILNEANLKADRIYIYDFKNDGTDVNEQEHNFGLVEAGMGNAGLRYAAKPGYLAMSAYNALMTDAQYVSTLSETDTARVYKFKADDGADLYAAWSCNGSGSFEIEAEKAIVYDLYGNATTKSADANGKITVSFGKETVYVRVGGLMVVNAAGAEITEMSQLNAGDVISLSGVSSEDGYVLAYGIYKNGILADVVDAGASYTVASGIDTIKVFVWESLQSLKPVKQTIVID